MKKIWVLTLFPDYFAPFKELGVIGQTLQGDRGDSIELKTIQISEFSPKSFKGVDSAPYGGGPGMVMRADVLRSALIDGVVASGHYGEDWREKLHIVYTGPRGKVWNNDTCKSFASSYLKKDTTKDIVFICGRYEGIDERFLDLYVNDIFSIGDFVLSGGELAVMTIIDSAMRFRKGSLGNNNSAAEDSFENCLLEHRQYTRPNEFDGVKVPDILLSGHHLNIEKFQKDEKIRITKSLRPDLYEKYKIGQQES